MVHDPRRTHDLLDHAFITRDPGNAIRELAEQFFAAAGIGIDEVNVCAELGSLAVKADAWHHRSDAITSAAAFIGIAVALWGGDDWAEADDWAALLASLLIAWNGMRLLRPALDDLMDRAPEEATLESVRRAASAIDGVTGIEKVLARRAGIGYFVTLHVHADPETTLLRAHEIGHHVKDAVMAEVPQVLDAVIHMEPTHFH